MPHNTLQKVIPSPEQLEITPQKLLKYLGYLEQAIPPAVKDTAAVVCEQLPEQLEAQAGYVQLADDQLQVRRERIEGDDYLFHCGPLITSRLHHVTQLVLFALTLGDRFDSWVRKLSGPTDPLTGFLADSAGALLAERLASMLEDRVTTVATGEGLGATRRFSPGYCDWKLEEQQQLFALLPDNCCGIRLQPSSLMLPLKSISGIIGVGAGVEKQDYACDQCMRRDCHFNSGDD